MSEDIPPPPQEPEIAAPPTVPASPSPARNKQRENTPLFHSSLNGGDITTQSIPPSPNKSKAPTRKTTLFTPSLYGGRFTRLQYFIYTTVGSLVLIPIAIFIVDTWEEASKNMLSENLQNLHHVSSRELINVHEKLMTSLDNALFILKIKLFCLLLIPTVFYFLPICIKRAHDLGASAAGPIIIHSLNLFVFWMQPSTVETIIQHSDHNNPWATVSIIFSVLASMYGLYLLFADSQKGRNIYGPSAKYPDIAA